MNREELVQDLREVRDSGLVNMFDRRGVIEVLEGFGYDDSATKVSEMKAEEYLEVLEEI